MATLLSLPFEIRAQIWRAAVPLEGRLILCDPDCWSHADSCIPYQGRRPPKPLLPLLLTNRMINRDISELSGTPIHTAQFYALPCFQSWLQSAPRRDMLGFELIALDCSSKAVTEKPSPGVSEHMRHLVSSRFRHVEILQLETIDFRRVYVKGFVQLHSALIRVADPQLRASNFGFISMEGERKVQKRPSYGIRIWWKVIDSVRWAWFRKDSGSSLQSG